ncbi:MAG: acetylglutamate kinase [Flavobacteriaceae bacterium]|nr:acetylglutamate kinase [Flavobacteriaceae bacterium]MBL6684384.1 acetylglutamate kinase [Flavobacteriaceae bacterium]
MKSELKIFKIGGKIISDNKILQKYINKIKNINENIILIHGGGNIANEYFSRHNLPIKMINGRRITDKKSLDILVMLYAGIINKNLVSKLNNSNNNFIGLSGADSKVIISEKRKVENIDYGYVGDIKSIDSEFIKELIKSKTYPVFCPITYDKKGSLLNTNADTIATKISIEMAKHFDIYLYYCFDKKGVIINNKVCNRLNENDYKKYLKTNQIKDGMIPKLENSFNSIRNGVKKVFIGDIDIFEKSNNNTEICLI